MGWIEGANRVRRGGLYRRLFAWIMARFGPAHDEVLEERKRRLIGDLRGTVLEVGAGAGVNLDYLRPEVRYLAVEPNVHMHSYLEEEAARHEIEAEVRAGTAEELPVHDASVDAVITSLVLCSVEDLDRALHEIHRVLRPGGRFVFLEHVGAPRDTGLRRWQRRVKPVWRRLGDGCEPDREIGAAIARVFPDHEIESFDADVPLALVRPHIAGRAWRRPTS